MVINMINTVRDCQIQGRPMVFAGIEELETIPVFPFPHLHDGLAPGWVPLKDAEFVADTEEGLDGRGSMDKRPVVAWARHVMEQHGSGVGFAVSVCGETTMVFQAYELKG